ncbi:MAG: NAD(P)H-dependent glycerol-3-phosphate dehydrogenase [Ilumatobacteraceae bacterium]
MTLRVAVIGAGSWGTTVASLAARNAPTVLWARRAELAEEISRDHRNRDYLGDAPLPDALRATADMAEAVSDADIVVVAVPSDGFRTAVRSVAEVVRPWVPIVSLSKGLEPARHLRMSQIIGEEVPGHPIAVLTGPNLAAEILAGQPAATVVAIGDHVIARALQDVFTTMRLRVYTNPDLVGCEVAGVVKNVIAIAAGMAEGMGFGDNTRATIITRGLAEMSRLGAALGGSPATFAGLAGMGDLIATCSSRRSRNTSVGVELGAGRSIDEIVGSMRMVAEGVKSSLAVAALAKVHGVEMPITEQVVAVCHEGRSAADALAALMSRAGRSEWDQDRDAGWAP